MGEIRSLLLSQNLPAFMKVLQSQAEKSVSDEY